MFVKLHYWILLVTEGNKHFPQELRVGKPWCRPWPGIMKQQWRLQQKYNNNNNNNNNNNSSNNHYLLYAGYLYMYSWDEPCP
jgi:hypothetical protein